MYTSVYDKKGNPKRLQELDEVEMEIPKSEADVERMMKALRQASVPV